MTKCTCDNCCAVINIPDGSIVGPNTIVSCNNDTCAEMEARFRRVFSDQNINASGNKGQWLKERIGWTKPAE